MKASFEARVGRITEVQVPAGRPITTTDELDITLVNPAGDEIRVPAFRAGERTWSVRFLPSMSGLHLYNTDGSTEASHGGQIDVAPAPPVRASRVLPLPISIDPDGRHFTDANGEPFLWLGDTWWYALSDRITDAQLDRLARRRVADGFSVVQIVAGLYPEIAPLDARYGLSGGYLPWNEDWTEIEYGFFAHMDRRIEIIVRAGLLPAIYGAWGYYLSTAGVHVMKRHWREIVARYAAYPVSWSVAGEATLPWYDLLFTPESKPVEQELADGWLDVARYVRSIDPYRRPLSAHPSPGTLAWSTTDMFDAPEAIDHILLQTGHWDRANFPISLDTLSRELQREPSRPVLNSEVCYEGIAGSNWPDTQRFLFWTHMLSGAAGHTYGAQGMWAMNDGTFVGRMGRWGSATWKEASELAGAQHLGAARLWLCEREWASLRPAQEVVEPHATEADRIGPYAAILDDGRRVVYFPVPALVEGDVEAGFRYAHIRLLGFAPREECRLDWYDPRTCDLFESVVATADVDGVVSLRGTEICALPSMEDWILEIVPTGARGTTSYVQ